MLKVRVIPTLLWKDFGLVKGEGFNSWRRIGSVLPAIRVYNRRDVDEMIFMDIDASRTNISPDYSSIQDFSQPCFVPFTVGGGITSTEQITNILHSGADKVLINTAAYTNPNFIKEAAAKFGAQCIVVGIDAKRLSNGKYACFSYAGTVMIHKAPVEWAKEVAALGAGEIMITSIDHDGTMKGYDLELTESITTAVDIPVIASGGAGNYEDMCQVVLQAGASAVAAASMFHFTEQTPYQAKLALAAAGIPVRQPSPVEK